jgi:hypothetical protein
LRFQSFQPFQKFHDVAGGLSVTIVAWKKGFFAQEGIQAEFIVMRLSIIPAALTNGEIHFSTALMSRRRLPCRN